jgi:hypothetical protein
VTGVQTCALPIFVGTEKLEASVLLEVPAVGIKVSIKGEIDLD